MLTLGLIFPGFTGLGISIWPNMTPPSISSGWPPLRGKIKPDEATIEAYINGEHGYEQQKRDASPVLEKADVDGHYQGGQRAGARSSGDAVSC